jgi:hypothetical protein
MKILILVFFFQITILFSEGKSSQFSKTPQSELLELIINNSVKNILEDNGNLKNEFGEICGTEYKEARVYHSLDIDEDGDIDELVFFTVEGLGCGASDYSFYLLTTLNNNNIIEYKSFYKIGGKGILNTDFEYLEYNAGRLLLKASAYAEDGSDPLCCPSKVTNFNVNVEDLILSNKSLDGYYNSNNYKLKIFNSNDNKFEFSIFGVTRGDICEIKDTAVLSSSNKAIFDDKESAILWKEESCTYIFDIFENVLTFSVNNPRCEMTYCGNSAYITRKYTKDVLGDFLTQKNEERKTADENRKKVERKNTEEIRKKRERRKEEEAKNNYTIVTSWGTKLNGIIEYRIENNKIIYKFNSGDGGIIESSLDCNSVKEIRQGNSIVPFSCQ